MHLQKKLTQLFWDTHIKFTSFDDIKMPYLGVLSHY
ncbi:hypothetical protein NSTCB13_05868 [Nostoc sp. DSM 114160]